MNPRILSLAIVAFSTAAVHAEDVASASPAQPYQLNRKSAFTATAEDQRAPFWPIGWVKRTSGPVSAAPIPEGPRVKLEESAFKVSSILLGSPSLAIINGRTYSEGEFIRQPRAAATGGAATVATSTIPAGARIRVYRIDDGAVVLQYQEQLITVGIKRPELAQKRGEEELLLEDRP